VIELDAVARKAKFDLEGLNKEKNAISKIVATKKKESKGQDKCEEEIAQSKAIDEKIEASKKHAQQAIAEQESALNKIGNLVSDRCVISKTEDDNRVERTFGTPNKDLIVDGSALGKLHHHEVMQCLDFVEFERGQKVAGHRGYYLKGHGLMLNQALISYGLATLCE
jgi:seryl-tRNA synthetase